MNLPNPIINPWFNHKTLGWGWTPENSRGPIVVLAVMIFIAVNISAYILIKE